MKKLIEKQGLGKIILQDSLLILDEFKQTNRLLSLPKSSGNLWFSDDFRGNRNSLVRLNSLGITQSAITRSKLTIETLEQGVK